MSSLKIFFIHAEFLEIRKTMCENLIKKLSEELTDLKIDHEFVLEHDPSSINSEVVNKFLNLAKSGKSELFDGLIKNIHVKQLSNSLKHLSALQKADSEKDKYDYFMVLEDDVVFGDDISSKVKTLLNHAVDYDLLFMGMPSVVPINLNDPLVIKDMDTFKVLPCCDSYLIPKASINKVYSQFAPIRYQTNIHFSYLMETTDIKVKATVPNIFLDGSKFGIYLSSLEANNKLFLNPEYNKLNSLVRKESYTKEDEQAIEEIIQNIKFKNHPDIMYLFALFELKNKNYEKAKEILENIHNVYMQNGCIVTNESEFLTTYMYLFKHFQTY